MEVGPLSFTFSGKRLYEKIYLRLRPGDFVHLKGPSGCGKTTMLRQIVGLEASEAERRLHGRLYPLSQIAHFRSRCLYLAPEAPILDGTISENLLFPYKFRNNRTKKHGKIYQILKKLGLDLPPETPASNLSTGERQRLALARALLFDPDVILADEPFSALDEENFRKAFELLYAFSRRKNKAVLCVSHGDLPRTTRVILLCEGKLKEP